MADEEWTVKNLMEALKRFPSEAKVYYEMGPNGPGTIGEAQYVKSRATRRWECSWNDKGAGHRQRNPARVATIAATGSNRR